MSSKESAKFWHEKCQVLEAKVAELETERYKLKTKLEDVSINLNRLRASIDCVTHPNSGMAKQEATADE